MSNKININYKNFGGCYDLFKYIVRKYKNELYEYNGSYIKCLEEYSYLAGRQNHMARNGVPSRIWALLHKDLLIAKLMNRINDNNYRTLHELKEEFKKSQENSN